MQPSIAMKFAEYVASMFLLITVNLVKRFTTDIEFFLGDYFYWHAL